MLKILLIGPLDIAALKIIQTVGRVDSFPSISKAELLSIIGSYYIFIVRSISGFHTDSTIIRAASNLKIIATPGSGTDHIDAEEAGRHNIEVCAVPGANSQSVAELTIGLVFALHRHLCAGDHMVRYSHRWKKDIFIGEEIRGKTLGIIGFGNIGSKVGRLAADLNLRVLANDPYKSKEYITDFGAEAFGLTELLVQSDIVSLHVPLNEETFHIISEQQIEKMKTGSYLLNLSRGGVVNEKAVIGALKGKKLAGAAFDVLEDEVPAGEKVPANELFECPNVIVTPHLGAWTHQAQKRTAVLMAEKIVKTLKARA